MGTCGWPFNEKNGLIGLEVKKGNVLLLVLSFFKREREREYMCVAKDQRWRLLVSQARSRAKVDGIQPRQATASPTDIFITYIDVTATAHASLFRA